MLTRLLNENLIEVKDTKRYGLGVFAAVDIPADTFICYYIGETVPNTGEDQLLLALTGSIHTRLLSNQPDESITYGAVYPKWALPLVPKKFKSLGPVSAYVNFSHDPNITEVLESGYTAYYTSKNIAKGEELLSGYDIHLDKSIYDLNPTQYICKCGSKNCTGKWVTVTTPTDEDRRYNYQLIYRTVIAILQQGYGNSLQEELYKNLIKIPSPFIDKLIPSFYRESFKSLLGELNMKPLYNLAELTITPQYIAHLYTEHTSQVHAPQLPFGNYVYVPFSDSTNKDTLQFSPFSLVPFGLYLVEPSFIPNKHCHISKLDIGEIQTSILDGIDTLNTLQVNTYSIKPVTVDTKHSNCYSVNFKKDPTPQLLSWYRSFIESQLNETYSPSYLQLMLDCSLLTILGKSSESTHYLFSGLKQCVTCVLTPAHSESDRYILAMHDSPNKILYLVAEYDPKSGFTQVGKRNINFLHKSFQNKLKYIFNLNDTLSLENKGKVSYSTFIINENES